ncbi:MAG: TetR/AcrR family transcriptional regulator [Clostridia bacterium]|nr:TetR/AcrR family transcriptional regulator [Clostridia bacterium]
MVTRKYDIIEVKSKILHAAAKLFLSVGYEKSTVIKIADEAKVNRGSVIYAFKTKENVVCELVALVLEYQFKTIEDLLKGKTDDKILLYACETVLQLHLAESSEHMREMYNVAYSLPNSANVIYHTITKKLEYTFKDLLPNWETKDFYEREISSAGVMRNHMSIPCDMYFTMERKIQSFLESTFLLYRVPDQKIKVAIEFVKQFEWEKIAESVLSNMLSYLESKT